MGQQLKWVCFSRKCNEQTLHKYSDSNQNKAHQEDLPIISIPLIRTLIKLWFSCLLTNKIDVARNAGSIYSVAQVEWASS
jgi:hypothetical protein